MSLAIVTKLKIISCAVGLNFIHLSNQLEARIIVRSMSSWIFFESELKVVVSEDSLCDKVKDERFQDVLFIFKLLI